jgi:hypothetical protein
MFFDLGDVGPRCHDMINPNPKRPYIYQSLDATQGNRSQNVQKVDADT